jgi:hypothetical protein
MAGGNDVPRFSFTIDYIESADGRPTGKVERVKYDSHGQVTSREELLVDPDELRAHGGRRDK